MSEKRKKEGRVKVSNLPQREKELAAAEAANIKGGGGASGGVLGDRKGETSTKLGQ